MQLFVRDGRSVVLEAGDSSTVADVAALYTAARGFNAGAAAAMILLHNGRQLQSAATLLQAGVTDGAMLLVSGRLRGGGGDGGSTGAESRSCYLEMYAEKKPDKVDPAEGVLARATRCRLSGERLSPPCVADELGCLFNKEALVHALLNKTLPPALAYITSLKAVVSLKLDPVPRARSHAAAGPGPSSANGANGSSNGNGGSGGALFQCPITGLEMNGRFPFVVHRPSGVVLSERALREVPAAAAELLGGPSWSQDDLIPLNPQGEELERRREVLADALAAERQRKAAKKAGKAASKAAAVAAVSAGADAPAPAGAAGVGSKRGLPPAGPLPAAVGAGTGAAGAATAAAAPGAAGAAAKKLKLPPGATAGVYASIFSSGEPKVKETFLCRSGGSRGVKS